VVGKIQEQFFVKLDEQISINTTQLKYERQQIEERLKVLLKSKQLWGKYVLTSSLKSEQELLALIDYITKEAQLVVDHIKFQETNLTSVRKILKKFDKKFKNNSM